MADIPNITERAPQRPTYVNQAAETAKGQGITTDYTEHVNNVLALFGNKASVSVTQPTTARDLNTPIGATGVPTLDNPADPEQLERDLEKLIAYLQLDNDKRQAEMAKERIELQKSEVDKRHAEQTAKIKESLEEMDKASRANLLNKIFGWLMAALAVVFAIVASVATGGAAVGAIIGAVVAVGLAVASETGAMEKVTEAIADKLQDWGMSEKWAQITAGLIIAAVTIIASVGPMGVMKLLSSGAQAATNVAMTSLRMAMVTTQGVLEGVMGVMGVGALAAGTAATVTNYQSGMVQADLTELEKFLAIMRQRLEESEEELKAVLSQIQNLVADIVAILDSETDTQMEIAQQMGAMA